MNESKKILMLTHEFPPYPGGVGRYCWSLAAAAARAGHSVTVLAPAHSSHRSDHYRDPPDVKVVHFTGDQFHFRELAAVEQLVTDLVRSEAWDVIHAADWPMIAAARRLTQAPGQRVASLHGSDVLLFRHSLRARLAGASRALRHFDAVVCNSLYTASLLRAGFPDVGAVHVAPLGVDQQWFDEPSTDATEAYLKRIGWCTGERIILTVARLDERKGHLATLASLARFPEAERATLKYVCVGRAMDREYAARIAATAKSLGVTTVLTGTLPDSELLAAYRLHS